MTLFIYVTAWSIATSISAMIAITEGAHSPYYAGLNFILIGMFLFPSNLIQTLIVSLGTILIYYLGCVAHPYFKPGLEYDWNILTNNIFFLTGTGVISSIASHFNYAKRFETFRLNYELEQRNKELAELDRLKSDFFANVSHELRTPLALILAPVQDILQNVKNCPDHLTQYLKVIETNTLRLLRLVNDILDIIRLEEGNGETEKRALDLNSHISAILESMQHLANKQKLKLTNNLTKESIAIQGDEASLEKIFINIISNAIKFTEAGGSIEVTTKNSNNTAVVIIKDTGIGIKEEDLPYIFDRFRQVDGSTTRKHQGLGLGLALVKELVETHDGNIQVRSKPDIGTVFEISFPLHVLTDTDDTSNLEASANLTSLIIKKPETAMRLVTSNDNGTDLNFNPNLPALPKILVVDDEPDMRDFLENMLSPEYNIACAKDGLQGLNAAVELMPDLVILDLMLPEIDGLEVCHRIKHNPDTQSIKVLLLTARIDEKSKLTALKKGADDFLTKPFSSTEVRTRIKNLIKTASLEKNLKQQNTSLKETLNQLKKTEAKLIHSEKLNSLGIMAAGLLHEVNNPINYSHFALQTIQQAPEIQQNDDLQDTFNDIDEGLQRVRKIVGDLKIFAYRDSKQADESQNFCFKTALEHALRFTAHEAKNISINVQTAENSQVYGSESHIIQVLVNLILNATKALKDIENLRKPEIYITTENKNDKLLVKIHDNGKGIEQEKLTQIFDPFFSTRAVGEGLGLGLSICHTIISNHEGNLTVASEPGEWTEFTFDLKSAMSYSQENMNYDLAAIK
ncbi:MAG: ATP-binding protein [Pseudomonadota bacterium]